ncbi:diguanylate cyclase [Dehalobacter sp. DCM]|uniref:sensor domain-containing diguanylate cyclase n=1 Tax=Dehalobacter sp. DCM TaxID=2907827 RepID=UPI003081A064|nr:diguanylate cyclase [Dehalobacter sp. DCM]
MTSTKNAPSLRQVLLQLVLFRLFLPLLVLGFTAIVGIAYLEERNLEIQQYQIAQSMATIVDHHLDQGGRILDAVAELAEFSREDSLSAYMTSTWKAYGYFDTLYYLDEAKKVKLLTPADSRYLGLDMANLLDIQQIRDTQTLIISRPFISLRTGEPTVYLIKALASQGYVVGELNLGLFQQEIVNITGRSGKDFVFIMDQTGALIAHPSPDLVKQQINLSYLEIFNRIQTGKVNGFYLYNGTRVLGSAIRVERTGWLVVDQVPLSSFFGLYLGILVLILFTSVIVLLLLIWYIRKQLQRFVITPLEQFSRATHALAAGDFTQASSLTAQSTAFAELNKLAHDFQSMSNTLQTKKEALYKVKEDLEVQVSQRTQELMAANKELQMLSSLDGLTGIGNRRYFDQVLTQEWDRGMRQGTTLALIMLDIDFFKNYNDFYGHQAGDDCLKQVAGIFKGTLRRSIDCAARYGGEEFAAILPDTDISGAVFLAEEMRSKIEEQAIKHESSGISMVITVSVGVAAIVPLAGSQPSMIIRLADQAMYQAKRNGRNRVEVGRMIGPL